MALVVILRSNDLGIAFVDFSECLGLSRVVERFSIPHETVEGVDSCSNKV